MRKHREIKLIITETRQNLFSDYLLAIGMKITQILCLGVSILVINKIVMYEICYDYMKQKTWRKKFVTNI